MKEKLATLRFVLLAILAWSAGAMFAAAWMWLFGLHLSSFQAKLLVVLFGVLGLVFGLVQVARGKIGAGSAAEADSGSA